MLWQRKKPREELSITGPTLHEATYAEESEEFSLLAEVFAPEFSKRVPGADGHLGKRVHLTAADKKSINKASIGLPVPRTLKLFTYNTRPFILELDRVLPLEEFRKIYPGHLSHVRFNPEFPTISYETRRSYPQSAPAVQQRISLSGATLYSENDQQTCATLSDPPPGPSESPQTRQAVNGVDEVASPVNLGPRLNNIEPEPLVSVHTWLNHADAPISDESVSSNLFSDLINSEELWALVERSARQRKSRLRQMPNIMSTETNNTSIRSIRGSNNTRPSLSYQRPGESSHANTNPIKDQPGTSARRPKSMPSGSQLPSCWNDEMDEFICHMEAQCEFSVRSIVRALKQKFAELREVGAPFF